MDLHGLTRVVRWFQRFRRRPVRFTQGGNSCQRRWSPRSQRGTLKVVLKLKAQVHEGRLKLDEPYDAPEGTEVDLAVVDDGDDLDEKDRARLHAAIARGHEEGRRGEVIPADEVLAKLRGR
jgi:hypothetical protein